MAPIAAKAGISVLIMLMGLFQDGITKLERKDYPGAIAALTQVIEHRGADAALRDRATFWRAMAHGKAGKATEAKADLAKLLKGALSPELRRKAFATLGQLGGDPRILLPKESPKQAFEATNKLGMDEDLVGFRKRLTGDHAAIFRMQEQIGATEGRNLARDTARGFEDTQYIGSEIGAGEDLGTARVVTRFDRGQQLMTYRFLAVGDEWHLDTVLEAKQTDAPAAGDRKAEPIPVVRNVVASELALQKRILLVGLFQEGLAKLDQKDYPRAIAAFTKVIEHRRTDAELRDRAIFWRGVAYRKSGKTDEAKADFAKALKGTHNPELRGKAFVAFGQLGGNPETLLPKETPEQAFNTTKKLGLDKELDRFGKRFASDFAAMFGMMEKGYARFPGEAARAVVRMCKGIDYGGSEVGKGKEFGTAKVMGIVDDTVLCLQLVAVGNEWQFHTLLEVKLPDRRGLSRRQAFTRQSKNMARIALACIKFSQDNGGALPKKLQELIPYVGEAQILEFVDPATGTSTPLLYNPAIGKLVTKGKFMHNYVVATPIAMQGSRMMVVANGSMASTLEGQFYTRVKEQGWEINPKVPVEVTKETAAKVEALIKQLGDPKATTRRAAYQELKKLGEQAQGILEKHRHHPDPEVRLTVRQLLK